jgi:hypothetical protein
MATWKPAPSVSAQTAGGDGPNGGKFPYGEAITPVKNGPPTPPFIGAPAVGTGNDGTDVYTTG